MVSVVLVFLEKKMESFLWICDNQLQLAGPRLLSGDDNVVTHQGLVSASVLFELWGGAELVDLLRLHDILDPVELALDVPEHKHVGGLVEPRIHQVVDLESFSEVNGLSEVSGLWVNEVEDAIV